MSGSLKEIRRKISSVKNTAKTTKTMKMVSTSKLRKARELMESSKMFEDSLASVFYDVVCRAESVGAEGLNSKFFRKDASSNVSKVDVVLVTADKGLCGGFNDATVKRVLAIKSEYESRGVAVRLRAIGKKGASYFLFNGVPLLDVNNMLSSHPSYDGAVEFMNKVLEDYCSGETDSIIIIHNGFKSSLLQELRTRKVLPIDKESECHSKPGQDQLPLNIDPDDDPGFVLDELIRGYASYSLYYALVDSLAAEHSARMQAMDVASNNAVDLVRDLVTSYNKVRQEVITTELVEINSGIEAMS